jgi:hypothetical protein
MKKNFAAAVLVIWLWLPATSARAVNSDPCRPHSVPSMKQETLERYPDGVWGLPVVFMARSEEQWHRLMSEMEERGELVLVPAPPPPRINWKNQNVIVISLGQIPTNGYGVEIRSVGRKARTALLDICVTMPSDPLRPQVLTFPYHMVQVAKTGVDFVEVCSEAHEFDQGASRVPPGPSDERRSDQGLGIASFQGPGMASFTNLTPPVPGADETETWGGLKARFR